MSSRRRRGAAKRKQNHPEFVPNPSIPTESSAKTRFVSTEDDSPTAVPLVDPSPSSNGAFSGMAGSIESQINKETSPSVLPDDVVMKDMVVETPRLTTEQLAEVKKVEGNALYASKDYLSAVRLYTEAIVLCPQCAAYYGNRAASYIMLGQYDRAIEDARKSSTLDPTFVKGYMREAKCHLLMGEVVTANLLYEKILSIEPNNSAAKTESSQAKALQEYVKKAEVAMEKKDYRTVLFCMERAIQISPECKKFRLAKAESLALLKRYQESQEIANDILRQDAISADAIYIRGICFYYQDNVEKAFQHFQQVLRLAPDHTKAREIYKRAKSLMQKKEEGNIAFKEEKYQAALDLYDEALSIDPNNVFTNAKLYFNKATACAQLGRKTDAVSLFTKAVELDDKYVKAYLKRAKCHMELEQYEEAVRDYEKCYELEKRSDHKQLLQDAKLELKKSKRKDYYKILGVSRDASEDVIKKAYRKLALVHHPDRHSGVSEEALKVEEKKFKEINEAHSILTDPKKKFRYDSGEDLEGSDGGPHNFYEMDPNLIFQSMFNGGGRSSGRSYNSFPSEFQFPFHFG